MSEPLSFEYCTYPYFLWKSVQKTEVDWYYRYWFRHKFCRCSVCVLSGQTALLFCVRVLNIVHNTSWLNALFSPPSFKKENKPPQNGIMEVCNLKLKGKLVNEMPGVWQSQEFKTNGSKYMALNYLTFFFPSICLLSWSFEKFPWMINISLRNWDVLSWYF